MHLSYLSQDDWQAFADRYPQALCFLETRALVGELQVLRRRAAFLTPWQRLRLMELEQWTTGATTMAPAQAYTIVRDTDTLHGAGGCRPHALAYRDPAYHQGLHEGFASSDAILHAIEQVTGVDLLDEEEGNAAQARWQADPDGQVAVYLAAHFRAEEGDTLDWGMGRLTYRNGTWS